MTNNMHISDRLYEALQLAFDLFGKDCRKSSRVPVMAHLLSVCALVQHDGGSEDEAIAALLHDCLEDKPDRITRADIHERFGVRVLQIVEIATDTPREYRGGLKPPWQERKENYLSGVSNADPALLRVTVADKIDNLRAIIADYERLGEQLWERFSAGRPKQLWYFDSALAAFRTAGCEGPLVLELERLIGILRKKTEENKR